MPFALASLTLFLSAPSFAGPGAIPAESLARDAYSIPPGAGASVQPWLDSLSAMGTHVYPLEHGGQAAERIPPWFRAHASYDDNAYGGDLSRDAARETVRRLTDADPADIERALLEQAYGRQKPPEGDAYWSSAQHLYENTQGSLHVVELIATRPELARALLYPLVRAAGRDAGDLLARLSRITAMPRAEALETLNRLEALRHRAAMLAAPGLERVMDLHVRRESEPLDDRDALYARIAQLREVMEFVSHAQYYPRAGRLAEEAADKLEQLQTAWVARWGGELPSDGYMLLTEGLTFVGAGQLQRIRLGKAKKSPKMRRGARAVDRRRS